RADRQPRRVCHQRDRREQEQVGRAEGGIEVDAGEEEKRPAEAVGKRVIRYRNRSEEGEEGEGVEEHPLISVSAQAYPALPPTSLPDAPSRSKRGLKRS